MMNKVTVWVINHSIKYALRKKCRTNDDVPLATTALIEFRLFEKSLFSNIYKKNIHSSDFCSEQRTDGELEINTFQGDNFERRIHDGWVSSDWSTNWIGRIGHVDDDNMIRFSHLLTHTDELVRFHRESTESDVAHVDANICQLKR